MDELFAPVNAPWQPVSRKLATVRRITYMPWFALAVLAAVAILIVLGTAGAPALGWWLAGIIVGCVIAGVVWLWIWSDRNARSWGYAENADDLLVTGGVMFRRLVAIPYGRMQYVDVNAGPIQRWYGIATVTLHTASTETAAAIPGVLADEARTLRDRLTEMGEAYGAGL